MAHSRFDPVQAKIELLQMKAELQRMEFGGQMAELKSQFAWVGAARKAAQWITGNRLNALGPLGAMGGQVFKDSLQKYPMLSAVGSALLFRYRKPVGHVALRAGAAALALAAAAWWFKRQGDSEVR